MSVFLWKKGQGKCEKHTLSPKKKVYLAIHTLYQIYACSESGISVQNTPYTITFPPEIPVKTFCKLRKLK